MCSSDLEHVYRAACKSKLANEVLVATDHRSIYDAVVSFGGNVEMTAESHKSGTDRMAEVASRHTADFFVNVQGDEPEIWPEVIDQVIELLAKKADTQVATVACPVSQEEVKNPNLVKVVCDASGHALYFSRAMIPHQRDPRQENVPYLGHIGIYGYRRDFLMRYPTLSPSSLEEIEKLEQLRVLENGYRIAVGITSYRSRGIDTPEDYTAFLKRWKKRPL